MTFCWFVCRGYLLACNDILCCLFSSIQLSALASFTGNLLRMFMNLMNLNFLALWHWFLVSIRTLHLEDKASYSLPSKWLRKSQLFVYRDDVTVTDIRDSIDCNSSFCFRKCTVLHRCDDYHTAEWLKASFTTVLGCKSINAPEDDTPPCVTKKPKRQTAKHMQLTYCEDCQTQLFSPPLPSTSTEVNQP